METVHESVCPLDCPDTCSLAVTVEDGRITGVDGSDRNPFTEGYICAKVRRYPERVYSPLRLRYPQRRVGAKGEGRFERISWDDALSLIAARFQRISSEDGAEAILPYHYGGSNGVFGDVAMDARFFNRLGASALDKTLCAAPTGAVYRAMFGGMPGVPPEDYRLARTIVLWGVNPSATGIHLVPYVREAQHAGAALVVVDPRRTPLARTADLHLQPLPGTDVVLALAMIAELVRRGLTDRTRIAEHANGYDELVQAASAFPLARAAAICGIDAGDIVRAVEVYAAASPAVIRCGWGVERNRNGGNAVRAIFALPVIAGKLGVRGGGLTMSLGRAQPINAARLAAPELRRGPVRTINMTQLGRVLTEPLDPPIRGLFIYNANPVSMTPDQNRIIRGLRRDDLFTVVHEQVMTDTARFADVLLPATTVFEQNEAHKSYGHYYLQYSEAVVAPVGEALSNHAMFARLAAAMGFTEPAFTVGEDGLLRDALTFDVERADAVDPDTLRTRRVVALRPGADDGVVQLGNVHPLTASGRIELSPPELGPLTYRPAAATRYPLGLLSPASDRTINSILGEIDRPAPSLHMHRDDAAARGLRHGQIVRVFNDLGAVVVPLRTDDGIRRGVVALDKGLWAASTVNGASTTALVADDLTDIGGGACFNDARVEVESAR